MVNFKYEYEYVSKMGPKVTLRHINIETNEILGEFTTFGQDSYDGTYGDDNKPIKNFPKEQGYKFRYVSYNSTSYTIERYDPSNNVVEKTKNYLIEYIDEDTAVLLGDIPIENFLKKGETLIPKPDPEVVDPVPESTPSVEDPINEPESQVETTPSESLSDDDSTRGENTNNSNDIQESVPTNGSIVSQLESSVKLSPIEFEFSGPKQSAEETVKNTGYFPFIWYNGSQISYSDIIYFEMSNSNLYPKIKMTFRDTLGLIGDKGMPLDDTKIKIFINSRNPYIKSIFIQFKIFNFSSNGDNMFTIIGHVDIDDLYISSYKSYPRSSSFDTIKKICADIGIGLNSNVSSSDDQMTWINFGEDLQDFILDIIDSSYISDQSFTFGYIDYYYNFNYIDVEKEINRTITDDRTLDTYLLKENSDVRDIENSENSFLFLTNDPTVSSVESYISSFKLVNNSTSRSLTNGYIIRTRYYDMVNRDLLNFDVDSLSDSDSNKIKMKSPNSYLSENNIKNSYNGKIDVDNSHINFNYAIALNGRNITELEKISMDVILPNPNFNLFKFQKIKLLIVNSTNTPSKGIKNERISGEWLVLNINWIMEKGIFYQKVRLVKRDLNLTDGEISVINNSSSNSSNSEYNDNPSDSNTDSSFDSVNNLPGSDDQVISGGDLITLEQLMEISGLSKSRVERFVEPLNDTMQKYQINTKSRITNFLSQVLHESGSLQLFTELASGKAYEGRKDLGNTQPGDGVRYKGRGAIQITGRNNYSRVSKALGYDFVSNPTKLAELPWAILSAGWFWKFGSVRGDLNILADREDFEKITRGINGGTNGIADRRKKLNVAKSIYKPVKPGDNNSLLA